MDVDIDHYEVLGLASGIDHYEVLGLASGVEGAKLTNKEISKAYKWKALELHPDKRPDDPNAHANFQKLKSSYEILKDEKARKLFDKLLKIKPEKQQQQSQQDSKKRKMMSDLEERERAAFAPDPSVKARQEEERIAKQLKEEMSGYRLKYQIRYDVRINQHCKVSYLGDFSMLLDQYGLTNRWEHGCFSHFSCLKGQFCNGQMIINILYAEVEVPWARQDEMWFRLGGRLVRFGPHEFVLVTGLPFGELPVDVEQHLSAGDDSVYARYFGAGPTHIMQLSQLLESDIKFEQDDDVLKLLYVFYLCHFLLGREIRWQIPEAIWAMVEDLQYFESFPWGTYIYSSTLFWLRNVLSGRQSGRKSTAKLAEAQSRTGINIYGFVFAVQMWAMEMIPDFTNFIGKRKNNSIPRIRRWYCRSRPQNMELYFHDELQVLPKLVPTEEELQTEYYRSFNANQIVGPDLHKRIPLHPPSSTARRGVAPTTSQFASVDPDFVTQKPPKRGPRVSAPKEATPRSTRHSTGAEEYISDDSNFVTQQPPYMSAHRRSAHVTDRADEGLCNVDKLRAMIKEEVAAAFNASQAVFIQSIKDIFLKSEKRKHRRESTNSTPHSDSGGMTSPVDKPQAWSPMETRWDHVSPLPLYYCPPSSPMNTRCDYFMPPPMDNYQPFVEEVVEEAATKEPPRRVRRTSAFLQTPYTVPKDLKNVPKVKLKMKEKVGEASTVHDPFRAFATDTREI